MVRKRAEEPQGERQEEGSQRRDSYIYRLYLTTMPFFCKDRLHPTQLPISQKPAGLSPVFWTLLDRKNNYLVEEDEIATSFHVIALTAKYLLLQKSFIYFIFRC